MQRNSFKVFLYPGLRIRLLDPPGRASIGRFRPECNLTKNFDDDKLYCGDYLTQHNWVTQHSILERNINTFAPF